jgi:hypothetical protein
MVSLGLPEDLDLIYGSFAEAFSAVARDGFLSIVAWY